jgi:hypothetical protein
MGILWDLIQHNQIEEQSSRATSLEQRVDRLEEELGKTRRLLLEALERIEKHLQTDVDGDGRLAR